MKKTATKTFAIVLYALLCAAPAVAQTGQVPGDLRIALNAGGIAEGAVNTNVQIYPDGSGEYRQYRIGELMAPPLQEGTFQLSEQELQSIWEAVKGNDFFALQPRYNNENIFEGTSASVRVTANGQTYSVDARNKPVAALDSLLAAINEGTPGEANLNYAPVTIDRDDEPTRTEPCCRNDNGVSPLGALQTQKALSSPERLPDTSEKAFPPKLKRLLAQQERGASAAPAVSAAARAQDVSVQQSHHGGHPGTVIGNRFRLSEAADAGLISLSSKGGFFGDKVKVSVDNSTGYQNPGGATTAKLYLELYGPAIKGDRVEAGRVASQIKSCIENAWSGQTNSGNSFDVQVQTLINTEAPTMLPPQNMGWPPNVPRTEGYHHIRLDNTLDGQRPDIDGFVEGTDNVNQGTAFGAWKTTAAQDPCGTFAHEAGHLLGLPDRYQMYTKLRSGRWQTGDTFGTISSPELAEKLDPKYPNITKQQIAAQLNAAPEKKRAKAPTSPAAANGIMGTGGTVSQRDIDNLAAQTGGVLVEARAGDVLVNKNGDNQNLTLTRSRDVFAPTGQIKTLRGLYTACIDLHDGIPDRGREFDVAPPLSAWEDSESAAHLQSLLQVAEERKLCTQSALQAAVWKVTNNSAVRSSEARELLTAAGIDPDAPITDFPRMSNPRAAEPGTGTVLPPQFFEAQVTPVSSLIARGEAVTLSGGLRTTVDTAAAATFDWRLRTRPDESQAVLSDTSGTQTTLRADVRGIYEAVLAADVTAPYSFTDAATARVVAADASTETFESGLVTAGRYDWQSTGDAVWDTSQTAVFSGTTAYRSGDVNNNQQSTAEVTLELERPGTVSFARRVSSEEGYDYLIFSIDGEERARWSGETGWGVARYDLEAGEHTLRWTYEKDYSFSSGADAAWIDDVFFPAYDTTPPEVALAEAAKLWPPNHKYVRFDVTEMVQSVVDEVAGAIPADSVYISSASSDEAENGKGDGNTTNDIAIAEDARSVQLRRERSGRGNGRVYTVNLAVSDPSGNVAEAAYRVSVPKNRGKKGEAFDDGPAYTVRGRAPGASTAATAATAGVANTESVPDAFALKAPYPNPARDRVTLPLDLPERASVRAEAFDVLGRRVKVLADETLSAGRHPLTFRTSDLASGLYLIRAIVETAAGEQKVFTADVTVVK